MISCQDKTRKTRGFRIALWRAEKQFVDILNNTTDEEPAPRPSGVPRNIFSFSAPSSSRPFMARPELHELTALKKTAAKPDG